MPNSMSKPILKKQRQVKAFAKAIIPLWPRATWVPRMKTGINEYSSSWDQILSKAEALEAAEVTIAELVPYRPKKKNVIVKKAKYHLTNYHQKRKQKILSSARCMVQTRGIKLKTVKLSTLKLKN
jgi:hypothetical protein